MGLDVLTDRGQETIAHEQACVDIWHRHYPRVRYAHTPKREHATVDAVLVNDDDHLVAVVEQKSRTMSLDTLASWDYEWLVTLEKVKAAARICAALRVPLVGFLYLVPDEMLLVRRICDIDGAPVAPIRTERTTTQATVNGGTADRVNAFVDMRGASWFTIHEAGRLLERRAA